MTNNDKILTILGELSKNVATILEEQQAQRTDIRSLQHDMSSMKADMARKNDLEEVKIELKDDIETAKIEVKAEIAKTSKSHNTRLTNLEEHLRLTDPTKH